MPPQTIVKVDHQTIGLLDRTHLVDRKALTTCVSKVSSVQSKAIAMIEGSANGDTPLPVQQAWLDRDVRQSGFCQPGRIMALTAPA